MTDFERAIGAGRTPIMVNVDAISHVWPERPDQSRVQPEDGRTVTALVPVGHLRGAIVTLRSRFVSPVRPPPSTARRQL